MKDFGPMGDFHKSNQNIEMTRPIKFYFGLMTPAVSKMTTTVQAAPKTMEIIAPITPNILRKIFFAAFAIIKLG